MNAVDLVKLAALSTAPYICAVSDDVLLKIERAYVAQWLYDQDSSVSAASALTALDAISQIKATFGRRQEEAYAPESRKRPLVRQVLFPPIQRERQIRLAPALLNACAGTH